MTISKSKKQLLKYIKKNNNSSKQNIFKYYLYKEF